MSLKGILTGILRIWILWRRLCMLRRGFKNMGNNRKARRALIKALEARKSVRKGGVVWWRLTRIIQKLRVKVGG